MNRAPTPNFWLPHYWGQGGYPGSLGYTHTMTIRIPTPLDFSFTETLTAHGWRRLAPFVWDEDRQTLSRPEVMGDGRVIELALQDDGGEAVRVTVTGGSTADEAEITRRVRRMLQLDVPLDDFHAYCRTQPTLAHLEACRRGRLLRCPTLFEDTLKVIATVNTTWAQTIAMSGRLVQHFGTEGRAFPTPAQIAAVPFEAFAAQARMGYRNAYVYAIATQSVSGELDLEGWQNESLTAEGLRLRLLSLPGIGPYGAACLMLYLGKPAHVNADSVARALLGKELGRPVTDKEVRTFFEGHGEWRGLVYNFYPWRGTEDSMENTINSAPQPGTQAASSQADAAPEETSAQTPRTDKAEIEAEEAAIGEGPEATSSPS